jgi:hypothetical protein
VAPMHVCRATLGVPTYYAHLFERLNHGITPSCPTLLPAQTPTQPRNRHQHHNRDRPRLSARQPPSLPPAATRRCLWGLFPCLTSNARWQAAGAAGAAVGDNPVLLVHL